MERVGAIVQARLASSRLPGKVAKVLPNDKTVIEYIVHNIFCIPELSVVIVAIPEEEKDSTLYEAAKRSGAKVFLGDAADVLSRYYHAAKTHQLDIILRITADDLFRIPAIEYAAIQQLINNKRLDYVTTVGLPEGMNTEAFRMRALEKAYQEAKLWSEREHVTPYIWKNKDIFRCDQIDYVLEWAKCRLTLDTPEDWKLVSRLTKAIEQKECKMDVEGILSYLIIHPELTNLNCQIEASSGYKKSLIEDYVVD